MWFILLLKSCKIVVGVVCKQLECVLIFLWCGSLDYDSYIWWMVIFEMWIAIYYMWYIWHYITVFVDWNVIRHYALCKANWTSQSYSFKDRYFWGFVNIHEILKIFILKNKLPYSTWMSVLMLIRSWSYFHHIT